MSRNPLERTDEPYLSGDSVCDTINVRNNSAHALEFDVIVASLNTW